MFCLNYLRKTKSKSKTPERVEACRQVAFSRLFLFRIDSEPKRKFVKKITVFFVVVVVVVVVLVDPGRGTLSRIYFRQSGPRISDAKGY